MTINQPNIADNSRLSITQAARVLEISVNTFRKYASIMAIQRHERAVGGSFYLGKDVKKVWLRIS